MRSKKSKPLGKLDHFRCLGCKATMVASGLPRKCVGCQRGNAFILKLHSS